MERIIKFRAFDGKEMTTRIAVAGNGHATTWYEEDSLVGPRLKSVDWPVMRFTGHQINGVDVYESDIVRLEENADGVDPEDKMTYYVVTWIAEWCMFALLRAQDEYVDYTENGAADLDTTMFWTFPLDLEDWPNSKHYLCGNIHEHKNLLQP